ncbi:uncharacterized protein LOC110366917 [Fundulus heteroclitus]|uniref:uncharacterized protein LOC110366917 n=1 Tax=Fundulus heteroclitus TaxID=8078 RepID=UPI00165CEAB8|nr:uncharacterized protein LOC110366917 [Fundulus heteroclitus]
MAEYRIWAHAADVDMELLNWSIAPDGYIPNSVIRDWKKKEKQQNEPHWKDFLFNPPCHLDEGTTSDGKNETPGNIWLTEVEDGEEEISFEVKRKRREKYNEPNKNEVDKQNINRNGGNKRKIWERTGAFKQKIHEGNEEVEEASGKKERAGTFKPKMHVRKEERENVFGEREGTGEFKPAMLEREEEGGKEGGGFNQMDSTQSENMKVFTEGSVVPQKSEVSLSLKNTDSFIVSGPATEEIRPHTPQSDLQDSTELRKPITSPLPSHSTPQQSSTIPREWSKSSMVSADAAISKQALDAQAVNRQTKLITTVPPVPRPPPPSPEDPPHTLGVCPPKRIPVQDPSFLLSPAKHVNIKDQSQTALDLNVLALFKRSKVHAPMLFPQTKYPGFSPTGGLYWQFDDISAGLHGHSRNLRGTPEFIVRLSAIHGQHHSQHHGQHHGQHHSLYHGQHHSQLHGLHHGQRHSLHHSQHHSLHHSHIQPEAPCPSHPADDQLTLPQFLYLNRNSSNRPTPEGRKTLHHSDSLQGVQSSRAVGQFAAEHPQEPPHAPQPSVTLPILQRGQAEPFQRVVQKIQLQDGTEPTQCCFSQVVPLRPQQSFVTSHQCGKTQYGKLQFDWTRGF